MSKTTLVIGASTNPVRYSNMAIRRLRDHHHPVYAVGLREGTVADVNITKQQELFADVHTVSLYVSPAHQENLHQYLIDLKPKRVIFNPGTEDEFFEKILRDSGIEVEEACTLVMLSTGQF